MKKRTQGELGFTLIELIIVVVILGILAALAIPQFTTSTQDANESTLKADLAILRNSVNLYYHEHNQTWPGAVKTDGSGTATAAADNPVAFQDQMLKYTDKDGKVSATQDPAYPYGPYLLTMPDNPLFYSGATPDAVVVGTDDGALTADGTPATGWKYSKVTGKLIGNNAPYETW